ncbi:MAG: hypothetical protein J6D47_13505 [Peptostreptococcaceae bacterium]|nr:hypothetical protein [Peptostreptococcaceae bacterium]
MPTISYKIENLISDPYEFEIFITDIYCLYLSDMRNIEYERIFVTSPTNDGGIDSIVIFKDSYNYSGNQYHFLQISKGIKNNRDLFNNFENTVKKQYKHIIDNGLIKNGNLAHHKKVCITLGNDPKRKRKDIDYICSYKLRELVHLVARNHELIDENNELNEVYKKNIEIRKKVCKHMNKYSDNDNTLDLLKLYNDYMLYNFKAIKDKSFGTIELVERLIDSRVESISGMLGEDFPTEKLQLLSDVYINTKDVYTNTKNESIIENKKHEMIELVDFVLNVKKEVEKEVETNKHKYKNIDLEVNATKYYIGLQQGDSVIAHFSYILNNHFAFKCEYDDTKYGGNNRILSLAELLRQGYKNNHRYSKNKDTYLINPDLSYDKDVVVGLVIDSLTS